MSVRKPLDANRELLEAFDHSCRVSEYLISVLPKKLWCAEQSGRKDRSIAAIVAHMQSVRRMFANLGGAEPPPAPLDRSSVTPAPGSSRVPAEPDGVGRASPGIPPAWRG